MKHTQRRSALQITLYYVIFAGAWIFFSDMLLALVIAQSEAMQQLQTVKGFAFVIATAFLLFSVLRPEFRQREQAEHQVHEQKELLQTIFDHIPLVIALVDAQGQIQLVNRAWEQVLGWDLASMHGRDMLLALYPNEEVRQAANMSLQSAQPSWQELQTQARSGLMIDVRWATIQLSDGTLIRIGQDVSEQRRLERHMLNLQKLESIARVAGGVAHDFNNILTAIMGYIEIVLEEVAAESPLREDLEEIKKSASRGGALTRQLLSFAHNQVVVSRTFDLNDLIDGMEHLVRRVVSSSVELVRFPAVDLYPINGDPGQIEQVILNLAINARDAMPQGGTLSLHTANQLLTHPDPQLHQNVPPGDYVVLTVSDTGIGMSAEVQAHLFEPFFTTKEPGKGTGLGLVTCYGIVTRHNGFMLVNSRPGAGTSFTIGLPRALEQAAEDSRPARQRGGVVEAD